ncbi:hypothetical protein CEUSTIGMA_g1700.t1 [Chlamydomonas eustigma]|uniref:Acyl-coenzyme A oxidase n=1 Tax=Chlamydomonas eustigma TaxID=1157962 RepID=A0A250WTV5_9CHLO|nr:hypothetical protein CEUSTIGMA_g1700.t1 [Chlamydomonas eustigma]|eukprot:GAX74251.1 hypothetical protein CEUSTIGMA_g1700.t1 [Chlamydomonas eustigma]
MASRLAILTRHLTAAVDDEPKISFRPQDITRLLVHDNYDLRQDVYKFISEDPLYRQNHYLGLMEFREQTLQRLQKFTQQHFFSVRDYSRDPRKFMAAIESLMYCDYSLSIKAGVHFTLCGGTICKLGTKKHHDLYLDRLDDLSLTGSFSMTELGHGSNVMGIETTALYDHSTREFIINTPTNQASKYWIGGTGQHGKLTAVFAQLTVNGKWEGPHVFMVRIRDDNMHVTPGVRIQDLGPKMGLNGVDNGQLWFHNVRVPRDAMLDAFSSVDDEGVFRSSIPSVSQRFATMVGGLTTGRLLIAQGAIDAMKLGVTIALRYSCQRPQFGDKIIMSYLTHRDRLLPILANAYALHLAMGSLKNILDRKQAQDAKVIHVLSSGIKAAATWWRVEGLQACRECCGGQGFLSANQIGPLATDMNVDVTFEGDNTVLMQQVARALLDDKRLISSTPTAPSGFGSGAISLDKLSQLLGYQEHALTYQVGSSMKAAAASKSTEGRAAAEQAANDVVEAELDTVVAMGWAHIQRFCLDNLQQTISKAEEKLVAPLRMLATLFGIKCILRSSAFFLGAGVLSQSDCLLLRSSLHGIYATLSADGGRLAHLLCEGFGIPEPLITAPIAKDWKLMGANGI